MKKHMPRRSIEELNFGSFISKNIHQVSADHLYYIPIQIIEFMEMDGKSLRKSVWGLRQWVLHSQDDKDYIINSSLCNYLFEL